MIIHFNNWNNIYETIIFYKYIEILIIIIMTITLFLIFSFTFNIIKLIFEIKKAKNERQNILDDIKKYYINKIKNSKNEDKIKLLISYCENFIIDWYYKDIWEILENLWLNKNEKQKVLEHINQSKLLENDIIEKILNNIDKKV